MLQSLDIKGLFGLYSYNLKFQTCEKDAITFITGPNGYGKTTILSLIHALYIYDFDFFKSSLIDESWKELHYTRANVRGVDYTLVYDPDNKDYPYLFVETKFYLKQRAKAQ